MAQGALTAAGAGEEVAPAWQYRALEGRVRELQRLLGKKTMENEVLREAVTQAAGPKKTAVALELVARGRAVSAAAAAMGVSRPHLSATLHAGPRRRRGGSPQPDGELVAAIGTLIADLPTDGYRRVHACCVDRPRPPGAQRPTPSASTG